MTHDRPAAKGRRRLDVAVTAAGLAPSRERARALILAGRVLVDGRRADKPGHTVPQGATIELMPGRRAYASRGGDKLAGVLEPLGVDPRGLRCLDVGASTGGFTDVLLRAGAAHVTALDVGRGLIDARLRADERVLVVEGVNARHVRPEQVRPPYDLVTVDVSFISLTLVLPALLPFAPDGLLLALVKPQFEVGRGEVGRGGDVSDARLRARAARDVAGFLHGAGWGILGVRASPLSGPKGNRELFLLAARGRGGGPEDVADEIEREVSRDVR